MSVVDSLVTYLSGVFRASAASTARATPLAQVGTVDVSTQRDLFVLLRTLYYGNDAYGLLRQSWRVTDPTWATTKALRSLQYALTEFYVALVMPGQLPEALPLAFAEDNAVADAVRDAIHQVWLWSNWSQRKQLWVRQQAMLGSAFLYVAGRPAPDGGVDRVYFHIVDPEHVTDLDVDERDYLRYIRTDVPVRERGTEREPFVRTEEWWKDRDQYRCWETPLARYDAARLGAPDEDASMQGAFGIDFVPFVHAKHTDVGEPFGLAPLLPALENQHELNRKATREAQLMFRHGKADIVVEGLGGSVDGQYVPPPVPTTNSAGRVEIDGEQWRTLPPGWTIRHLIANLPYDAMARAILADLAFLAVTTLPELNWYMLAQSGNDESGAALQTRLRPAIARVEEARGNAEYALMRANQMALTIAQNARLPRFEQGAIGTYEQGTFEHTFVPRDVIPATQTEELAQRQTRAGVLGALVETGMELERAMSMAGYSDDEVERAGQAARMPPVTGL